MNTNSLINLSPLLLNVIKVGGFYFALPLSFDWFLLEDLFEELWEILFALVRKLCRALETTWCFFTLLTSTPSAFLLWLCLLPVSPHCVRRSVETEKRDKDYVVLLWKWLLNAGRGDCLNQVWYKTISLLIYHY